METVKSIPLGLTIPFRVVEHVDVQACGEIGHSRLHACTGIFSGLYSASTLEGSVVGDVVGFRFNV